MTEDKKQQRVLDLAGFFDGEYVNYGSYDNYRKIASYIDGLKPSARKTLFTALDDNITQPIKVSQLAAKVSEKCQYLHGEASLIGVVVGCAQDFPGSNNMPLLRREGNFGTRFVPEAAAPRYIKTCKEKGLEKLFRPEDDEVLDQQIFEGERIEPKFYVPVLPMILVNGSDGLSTGFAQKILPRNPEDVRMCLKSVLSRTPLKFDLTPWYRGFEGMVRKNPAAKSGSSWEIVGRVRKISGTSAMITELPIGYDLDSYIKILDKLEEDGVITTYKDMSNGDKFKFEVKMTRKDLEGKTEEMLAQMLKLVKKETENFTCCNEELSITEFKSVVEILKAYITVRRSYLGRRKAHVMAKLKKSIMSGHSKYVFVRAVVDGKLVVGGRPYGDVVSQLSLMEDVRKGDDGTYDYLLDMPVRSLTQEKCEALKDQIRKLHAEYKELEGKTVDQIWLEELEELKL